MLKNGEDRSSALEAASLEALMKQRERLHAKALEDKQRRLRKLQADVAARANQNQEVAVHLVTLGKVLEEQQRLQAGMQSANEQAARRMRSLVTHKKLKDIALAQQAELTELRAQLEKLRWAQAGCTGLQQRMSRLSSMTCRAPPRWSQTPLQAAHVPHLRGPVCGHRDGLLAAPPARRCQSPHRRSLDLRHGPVALVA